MSVVTARKWVARAKAGEPLPDRSSAPLRIPNRLPAELVAAIEKLRRLRMTAAQIAEILRSRSRRSPLAQRIGLGKRSRLEPFEPPNRYERRHPGELVHVDIKTLGRISARGPATASPARGIASSPAGTDGRRVKQTGWEYVHVMIDDHSRLAYAEVLPDLTAIAAVGFLSGPTPGS